MKILHTVEFYSPSVGGMQEVVKQLSERLVKLGHEVTVATTDTPLRSFDELNGVKIKGFAIKGNYSRGFQGEISAYEKFLLDSDFDIIVNFAAQQWTTDLTLPLLHKLKAKKVFVPTGFSGLYHEAFGDYFKKMQFWMKEYDLSIYLSEDYRDINFARSHNLNSGKIIPNGADENEFNNTVPINIREQYSLDSKSFILLTIGSHSGSKGHHEAIQIFSGLNISNATLLIIGNENLPFHDSCSTSCHLLAKKFNNSFKARRLNKKILIIDTDRRTTIAALQQANLFLFTSNIECSPIVLFESMAASLPFVTTDVGNSSEIIKWTNGGELLPTYLSNDGKSFADISGSIKLIEELITDKPLMQKLAKQGHTAWSEKYSWDHIVHEYEKAYLELLKGSSHTSIISNRNLEYAVDVVIPSYNNALYIKRAIESVQQQTYRPKNIIVVDDGSTDNTIEIVNNISSKIPLHLIKIEHLGVSAARNAGIKFAKSEWIALLDADDVWSTNKLEAQCHLLNTTKLTNVEAVYTRTNYIDNSANTVSAPIKSTFDPYARGNIFDRLLQKNRIHNGCSSILVKKTALNTAGNFDTTLNNLEDWDLWLRLAKNIQFDYVFDQLVSVRLHNDSLSSDNNKVFDNFLIFINKWIKIGVPNAISEIWGAKIADRIIDNLPETREYFKIRNIIPEQSEKALFSQKNGSLKQFLLARILLNEIKTISNAFRISILNLKKILITLVK